MTLYLLKKERIPVPPEVRARVRRLDAALGRGRAMKLLHISRDTFMDLLDPNAIAIASTIASVTARLEKLEK